MIDPGCHGNEFEIKQAITPLV